MKKFMSVLLVMVMVFSALPIFAADSVAEEVLLKVKEKIDVPEELSEFSYSENKYDDVLRYDFNWYNEDYTKELYVSTDSHGRIVTYNYYEQMDYSQGRTLIDYTLSDARPLAEEIVKRMFPEYVGKEHDRLVLEYDEIKSTYSGRYKTFVFPFQRYYEQNVESNRVVVRVRATKDRMYVQSVNASLDEDATFIPLDLTSNNNLAIGDYDYEQKFPIELYYATDYSEDEPVVKLFYSIEKGYLRYDTGEIITEEYFDRYAGVTEDSASMEAGGTLMNKNEAMLSPEEKGEIEKMESLIKSEEIEKTLRDIEILKITEDMKFIESYTYKSEEKYFVRFTLEGEERRMNVAYNGETGEVVNISSYMTKYDKEAEEETVAESVVPEEEIKAFATLLSGTKLDETEVKFNTQNEYSTLNATRLVNGVPYPENSINVTYDAKEEMVTRYTIYWDEDVSEFPKPEEAMGLEKAREIIFRDRLEYVWLKQKDGYVFATTIENAVTIDAITGEELYVQTDEKVKYTDIDSHWAKDIINILWEHDIYLPGDTFKPDEAITQADMIYLFSACRDAGIIPLNWTKERIAEYGFTNGYVEATEPDKLMTRREAFKAMVEILGYGEVADFDIYKSSYSDMEPCGSAEILKAMGVLTGDTARPDDYLTRAEAAVMVYRYLARK